MGLSTVVTLLLGPRTLGRAYEEIENPGFRTTTKPGPGLAGPGI
jgi:hypothetical protein